MLYCAATWWTASTVDNDEKAHRRARRMPPGVASCVPHVARCRVRGAAVLCAGKYRAGRGRLRDCTALRPFPAWRPRGTCARTVTSVSCTAPAHSHERICHTTDNVRPVVLRRTRYLPALLHWRTERAAPLRTTASRNSELSTRGKLGRKESRLLRSPESTPCAHRKCSPTASRWPLAGRYPQDHARVSGYHMR